METRMDVYTPGTENDCVIKVEEEEELDPSQFDNYNSNSSVAIKEEDESDPLDCEMEENNTSEESVEESGLFDEELMLDDKEEEFPLNEASSSHSPDASEDKSLYEVLDTGTSKGSEGNGLYGYIYVKDNKELDKMLSSSFGLQTNVKNTSNAFIKPVSIEKLLLKCLNDQNSSKKSNNFDQDVLTEHSNFDQVPKNAKKSLYSVKKMSPKVVKRGNFKPKVKSKGKKRKVTKYSIQLGTSKSLDNGKRIYDNLHCCLFCSKKLFKISRHLLLRHKKEERVKEIRSLPLHSKERSDGFLKLIREGDFYYNCRVIQSKDGELILGRRPTTAEAKFLTVDDYEPCDQCLGFFMKKYLKKHKKHCLSSISAEVPVSSRSNRSKCNLNLGDISGEEENESLPDQNGCNSVHASNNSRVPQSNNSSFKSHEKIQPKCEDVEMCDNASDLKKLGNQKSKTPAPINNAASKNINGNEKSNNLMFQTISKHHTEGQRVFDKLHSCAYCRKKIFKIGRHLRLCHKNEEKVKVLKSLREGSKERTSAFLVLVREGDFHHNVQVLKSNQGELFLIRRPQNSEANKLSAKDFKTCPKCLGFLQEKHLKTHLKECPASALSKKSADVFCSRSKEILNILDILENYDANVLWDNEKILNDNCGTLDAKLERIDTGYENFPNDVLMANNKKSSTPNKTANHVCQNNPANKIYLIDGSDKKSGIKLNEFQMKNCEVSISPVKELTPDSQNNHSNKSKDSNDCTKKSEIKSTKRGIVHSKELFTLKKIKSRNSQNSHSNKNNDSDSDSEDESGIKLPETNHKPDGSRLSDRRHFCLFCSKLSLKIGRHLQGCHKKEERVKYLLSLPQDSKERSDGFLRLRREGDYKYNEKVIEANQGELILARRPSKGEAKFFSPKDFAPCDQCLGFFLRKRLSNHQKSCKKSFSNHPERTTTPLNLFNPSVKNECNSHEDTSSVQEVLSNICSFRCEDITEIVKNEYEEKNLLHHDLNISDCTDALDDPELFQSDPLL